MKRAIEVRISPPHPGFGDFYVSHADADGFFKYTNGAFACGECGNLVAPELRAEHRKHCRPQED